LQLQLNKANAIATSELKPPNSPLCKLRMYYLKERNPEQREERVKKKSPVVKLSRLVG